MSELAAVHDKLSALLQWSRIAIIVTRFLPEILYVFLKRGALKLFGNVTFFQIQIVFLSFLQVTADRDAN